MGTLGSCFWRVAASLGFVSAAFTTLLGCKHPIVRQRSRCRGRSRSCDRLKWRLRCEQSWCWWKGGSLRRLWLGPGWPFLGQRCGIRHSLDPVSLTLTDAFRSPLPLTITQPATLVHLAYTQVVVDGLHIYVIFIAASNTTREPTSMRGVIQHLRTAHLHKLPEIFIWSLEPNQLALPANSQLSPLIALRTSGREILRWSYNVRTIRVAVVWHAASWMRLPVDFIDPFPLQLQSCTTRFIHMQLMSCVTARLQVISRLARLDLSSTLGLIKLLLKSRAANFQGLNLF